MLVVVAALGVLGAAAAGLLVARTALRPVDRLTEAVEHIASTEDSTPASRSRATTRSPGCAPPSTR